MSDILHRVRQALTELRRQRQDACDDAVIYLGRFELYELMSNPENQGAVYYGAITPNSDIGIYCYGVAVVEVRKDHYLRVV